MFSHRRGFHGRAMTDTQVDNGKNTGTGKGRPPAEHRFKPGNPGRPKGSSNRATALLDALADDDLPAICKAIIAKARKGDLTAARLVLDRVAPAPRARTVELDLPRVGMWNVADTVIEAFGAIAKAAAEGRITPAEAVELVTVVEAQRKAVVDMRPTRLKAEPTPEEVEAEIAERKRLADQFDKIGLGRF